MKQCIEEGFNCTILEKNFANKVTQYNIHRNYTFIREWFSLKSEEAKKEWKRMAKQLEHLGILTEIDMAAFAGYCQAYARWKEAEEFITQHGTIVKTPSGYWQQVPQVSIAQTYLKIMNKFCEQFGLTPSARSRISTDSGEDKQNDEMELLLVKGGAR